jgi:HPt (histidine-containing phosphotransfer) domain-containing protein
VRDGLARVAGNQRLYKDLLMRFGVEQCDVSAQISAALERGDPKLAERIAHTVKGVAGNLGIGKIFSSAGSLEKAIHEQDTTIPALLREFCTLLDQQIRAIQRALPDDSAYSARQKMNRDFDAHEASSAARRLRQLLEASDGGATEAFSALTDATGGVVDKLQLDALGEAINEFDFESALSKLSEIDLTYLHSDSPNEH